MLYESIKKLVQYGINTGLTPESERIYTTNLLLDLLKKITTKIQTATLTTSFLKTYLLIF